MNPWQRTELIYGEKAIEKFKNTTILIAGLGGVGSYSAEAIARCFIGKLILVDFDTYDITNLNRQLHSSIDTLGKYKVDNISSELSKINPDIGIKPYKSKIDKENIDTFFKEDKVDFIIDAIDDIQGKISLIEYCKTNNIDIISCMGTGNRRNPQSFEINDIAKTYNCPLAKKLRKELRDRKIYKHTVVFSKELPVKSKETNTIGSNSFVPASAGLLLASYVINKIVEVIE
jgi:tRNA A37 threonylcarbamoyladenosine dehydratase